MVGYLIGTILKPEYIGCLGFLPALMGVHKYYTLLRERHEERQEITTKVTMVNGGVGGGSGRRRKRRRRTMTKRVRPGKPKAFSEEEEEW